ncbi:hypothetical protein CC86DRAFT_399513 [Ophiobolus disseminans]|uniref:Uncharacterized protein n=1 Tax=Ophiobolus disseminans TaxID=1469910 RepID=A0A6A7AJH5_9PLEO|nr:hypothetical protein CC86DRAFT_399513 [Ophiobolus disseminans]
MSLWREITHTFHELSEVYYLSIPTWLAIGATLQLISLACLPARLSASTPVLYLVGCVTRTITSPRRVFETSSRSVKRGRWTAELPAPNAEDKSDGLVIPLGPLAPGNDDIGRPFDAMWAEAETNRNKWGFLGQSGTLHDTTDSEGVTMTWLSYWKDLNGLQRVCYFGTPQRWYACVR